MREASRLAYLEALGVANWVPRRPLAKAAPRRPVELDPQPEVDRPVAAVDAIPVPPPEAFAPKASSARTAGSEAVRAAVSPPRGQSAVPAIPAHEPVAQEPALPAVAPFYLQLWQAGPCALLLQLDESGLASGSPVQRLLGDILRAAELPTPRLLADFRWPMIRNQADRSAVAASQGLGTFVQARLEEHPVVSIGCFGSMPALLAEADVEQLQLLYGREEALDGLPPVWFAPELDELMRHPEAKARLWGLIKRVKSRWKQV